MKRGQHDSEYDKIRRAAGYGKPQYEFPEVDHDAMYDSERVEAALQDFRACMAEVQAAEAKRDTEILAKHAQRREEIDRRMLLGEYERLGLVPLEPLISLGLAINLGWTIEHDAMRDRNVLVAPPRISRERWPHTISEDYHE